MQSGVEWGENKQASFSMANMMMMIIRWELQLGSNNRQEYMHNTKHNDYHQFFATCIYPMMSIIEWWWCSLVSILWTCERQAKLHHCIMLPTFFPRKIIIACLSVKLFVNRRKCCQKTNNCATLSLEIIMITAQPTYTQPIKHINVSSVLSTM